MDPRLLTPADLDALMRLKQCAGWNQTEGDWLRLMQLEPNGCFGIEVDGVLAASATVVCYARQLAWIGMVLTLPEYRKQGLARALMERCLKYAGKRPIGLDASDMGKALYISLGFVEECPVERWCKQPGESGSAYLNPDKADSFPLDTEVNGVDRSDLLSSLQMYQVASLGKGYAFGRPGSDGAYFGPCAAESPDDALDLLRLFLKEHAGEKVYWDLLPANKDAKHLAYEHGFRPLRKLTRMVLHKEPKQPDPRLYAIAGLEYG
jgi:GNAT superfamily N-acetyltransferase